MTRCIGACKRSYTRDFTPEAASIPISDSMFGLVGVRYGIVFMLHDTQNCPDRLRWRMSALRQAAQRLRSN